MRQLPAQQRAELLRVALGVVDPGEQDPFVAHAPAGLGGIALRRADEVAHRVLLVDRHQHVAQLIARGMQRDGQRHRHVLFGELLDPWDQPACRHDDAAWADAQQLRVGEPAHRLDDRRRQAPVLLRQEADRVDRLLDDLVCLEVAPEWKFPGRAERTPDRTAGL